MLRSLRDWFERLSTATKLLVILTAAVLPIGLGLVVIAYQGVAEANNVLRERSIEQTRLAARAVESLIARNALALRIAANGRIDGSGDACETAQRSLTIAPAVTQRFVLSSMDGRAVCEVGGIAQPENLPIVAPGGLALSVSPTADGLILRVGVIGGMATTWLADDEVRAAALSVAPELQEFSISDGERELDLVDVDDRPLRSERNLRMRARIANDLLTIRSTAPLNMITTEDRLVLLLPVLMWVVAALMTWVLVTRLLIRPLRRLQRAVGGFQPGDPNFELPRKLGPAMEILELRDAFGRAVARVEESEREMTSALGGQRRLVREVHHRVKNNLQVVASLLNIHGRSAETVEARAAYAAIGRRVGALSIVHRNHFAEMEENRGISLRPLLSELAAELRAGAPDAARGLRVELDMEGANTTQDVAVSVAFLVTEIVEFAMLRTPEDPVEISLRRTSDLTARLAVNSPVLIPDSAPDDRDKLQFERIVSGLAKQLRSELERKLGRYSVDMPVFPPA